VSMSGYTDCACRDCFDIAIGDSGRDAVDSKGARVWVQDPALCGLCKEAGCDESGNSECKRPDAYGMEEAP